MLSEVTYNQEDVRKLIQDDIWSKYGNQFVVDQVIIMDEQHETTVHRFDVACQIRIETIAQAYGKEGD